MVLDTHVVPVATSIQTMTGKLSIIIAKELLLTLLTTALEVGVSYNSRDGHLIIVQEAVVPHAIQAIMIAAVEAITAQKTMDVTAENGAMQYLLLSNLIAH